MKNSGFHKKTVVLAAVLAAAVLLTALAVWVLLFRGNPGRATKRALAVRVEAENVWLMTASADAQPGQASYALTTAGSSALEGAKILDENGRRITLKEIGAGDYLTMTIRNEVLLSSPMMYVKVYTIQKTGESDPALAEEIWRTYQQPGQETEGGALPEKGTVWQADLDGDGAQETLRFDREALEQEGTAEFAVEAADGTRLYTALLSTSHAGWNTVALYTDPAAGRQYLMEYLPYVSTGAGYYSYTLYTIEDGQWIAAEQGEAEICYGMPYTAPDNDPEALASFVERVNELWANAALLVTTDGDVMAALGGGGPACMTGTPEQPVRYEETLSALNVLLGEDPELLAQAQGAELRERIELGNLILARHRAEAAAQN